MKKLTALTILICLVATSGVIAQHKLEVTIVNIQEIKGTVRMALFDNEKDFLKTPVDKKEVKVSGTSVTVVFEKLKPGDYGISVIQDVNDNKELDKGFMGIPNEPYGFSNNARGKFGPPAFEKAKISVKENVKTSIKVE
jgi:uncharacterized protein (DUF2141 family)